MGSFDLIVRILFRIKFNRICPPALMNASEERLMGGTIGGTIVKHTAGLVAAAGLDVYEGEPQVHPDLLSVPNVVLTPHIASATPATRLAMANLAADNLIGFLCHGKAVTPVNPEVLAAKE